jgi:hypothetical protein
MSQVVDGKPDPRSKIGMNLVNQTRMQIAAPKYGSKPGQQEILYRIYARDKGTDETGKALGLPRPLLALTPVTSGWPEAALTKVLFYQSASPPLWQAMSMCTQLKQCEGCHDLPSALILISCQNGVRLPCSSIKWLLMLTPPALPA